MSSQEAASGPSGTPHGGSALMTGLFTLAKVALVVAVVGAVDWLWIGLFKYNFIAAIFGSGSQPVTSTGERIIYIAFGAGGIIALLLLAAGPRRVVTARPDRDVQRDDKVAEEQRLREEHGLGAVSYTHLTLPTIYSV